MEGALDRREAEVMLQASMTANLMNCWIENKVTARQLLGWKEESKRRPARHSSQMGEKEQAMVLDQLFANQLAAAKRDLQSPAVTKGRNGNCDTSRPSAPKGRRKC